MPRGRPRQFDAEKTLDTAMRLFWRYGYEGTSMAMLTDATGLNTPSLYAAFGGKEELFRRIVDRYLQKPASYLPNALQAPTAHEAVERLFDGAINMVMQRGAPEGCLLVHGALASGPAAEGVRKDLARRRAGAEAAIRKRFEMAQSLGDLPASTDAAKVARYIMTVIWGMSVQAAGGATREELQSIAEVARTVWDRESGRKQ